MPTDLTEEVRAGTKADAWTKNPYLFSSDAWLGFEAGRRINGMSTVRRAWKSRGHRVKAETTGGSTVTVTFRSKLLDIATVDRS